MPTTTETRMTKEYGVILPESLNAGGGSGGVGLVEYASPSDYISAVSYTHLTLPTILLV